MASRLRSLKRLGISGMSLQDNKGEIGSSGLSLRGGLLQNPHDLLRPSTKGGGHRPPRCLFTGDNMIPLSEFAAIDAALNATSVLILILAIFLFAVRESRLIRFACFRRLQPPRFFSAAISGTALTTVSRASPDKAPCAIFTWHCSVRTQFSRWSSCR